MPVLRRHGYRDDFDPARLESAAEVTYALTDGTAIKVGKSRGHPKTRLDTLQTGNPRELRLLAWTTQLSEAAAHRALRRYHLRGEWFRLDPALLRLISLWDWADEAELDRLRSTELRSTKESK